MGNDGYDRLASRLAGIRRMSARPKILCIEDDPATVELMVEVLEEEGFEPIVAFDGVEGVKKFDERPNLILCDVDMPRMSGFGVLQEFRKSGTQVRNVPFLFITAYGSRESHLQARRLGCDDFIAKPLDFELLVEIVRNRLARRSAVGPADFELTDREVETLTWVAKGKSSADTATLMGVSERTVNFHVNNVIRKAGVATRVQAAIRCALLGLISP
jgi:DNA-binding NarL/FixJ family response regulator